MARLSSPRVDLAKGMRGFTLVELMVVVALVVIVIALTAPSFKRQLDYQRVQSIASEVVTDLQFARSEAAARGQFVRITFRENSTAGCYSIYTYSNNGTTCDCRNATPCIAAGTSEIKTARYPRSTGVRVLPSTSPPQPIEFGFEPTSGSLYTIPIDDVYVPLAQYIIRVRLDATRELQAVVGRSGRPTLCAPSGSVMRAQTC
jgi:type IV fimbrial biogenesis protein FimT